MENSCNYITRSVGDNMKILLRIFFIITIVLALTVPSKSFADDLGLGDLNAYRGTAEESTELMTKAETVLGVIQVIGTVVAVVMLMVIGIKYMLGSVEERAEYKDTLKPYLIGALLLFSGTTIPQIIYKIAQNL